MGSFTALLAYSVSFATISAIAQLAWAQTETFFRRQGELVVLQKTSAQLPDSQPDTSPPPTQRDSSTSATKSLTRLPEPWWTLRPSAPPHRHGWRRNCPSLQSGATSIKCWRRSRSLKRRLRG
ncbi:hypothetical protein M427DRAFT_323360 [Gonapodya prolifera JEL478]|uniref:Uncharacterized protein n=1 Tax=Gonapodya prolifera (strain JEL478) TaxID=1344416 RepID=A0A139AFM0_GONPJ|nr:hypothetical protein M427DRAFT_323360 [Gonapodya prolifera JEL478]|eukprot:KXS15611.1 hypothetical protein M427DRAFT_323360 [Gonapodya prolifera JEL478]